MSINIIVTGGAGYIGSHACKALAKAGYTPIVYDNLVAGNKNACKWGPLEVGDIADKYKLREVFEKYRPKAVMHFAAHAYVGESVIDPEKYYNNNVVGTIILAGIMREFGVDKIIFSSTCATYGSPKNTPIKEDHVQIPINPYGRSKLMIEQILKDFDIAYGLKSISFRYFNAAGADPELDIGELHNPETHLIPLALDVAIGKRSKISIFGADYDTPDGTCVRDYIHVSDLADAHVLGLRNLLGGSESNFYNLGSQRGFSVREIINEIEVVTGKIINFEVIKRRPGDPSILIGDSVKVKKQLNWNPKYGSLNLIIMTAWKWHCKNSD